MKARSMASIVLATLLMQVGIGLLMAVWFKQFLFLYIFWVPWDRVGRCIRDRFMRLRAPAAPGEVAAR